MTDSNIHYGDRTQTSLKENGSFSKSDGLDTSSRDGLMERGKDAV